MAVVDAGLTCFWDHRGFSSFFKVSHDFCVFNFFFKIGVLLKARGKNLIDFSSFSIFFVVSEANLDFLLKNLFFSHKNVKPTVLKQRRN